MGGLYSPGALLSPNSSGHRAFFLIQELTVDSSGLNILQMRKCGTTRTDTRLVWVITSPWPAHHCTPSYHHSPLRAGHFHRFRGTESSGAGLRNAFSHSEQPSGNLAAQHFWKHPAELSRSECPRNQQPILVNALGNVSLPRSRKSVAGEVTGSSGSSPVSQPQNFLPPLTITYVGFLNSFFLHSCLNSTGKRKRRLDVEN